MAEFQKVIKERKRMCNSYKGFCKDCPLGWFATSCLHWASSCPDKAEKIIMQWSAEHPLLTNGEKFEEVFGFNASIMFEVNRHGANWLEEEYKGGTGE